MSAIEVTLSPRMPAGVAPAEPALVVQLSAAPIMRGPEGPQGDPGDVGDMPSLTLLFENALI